MAKRKTISVMGKVERIITDRTRFKMYSPEVSFEDLYVQFEIPSSEAVQKPDGTIIVTLDGFALHILDVFASKIELMHGKWEEEKIKADVKTQKNSMQKSRKKTKK